MIVRPAQLRDADEIAAFWAPLVRDTTITFTSEAKTPKEVADMITSRAAGFIVAEAEEKVVGFATFGPFRSGPGYRATAELSIILSDKARGKDTGRALLTELEQTARKAGIHVLVAAISADNMAAIAFHRALGYVETGRMPEVGRKFERWLDLVLMQKKL